MMDHELVSEAQDRQIRIGDVLIGGGAPVSVQSMTKTDTRDVRATVAQIRRLEKAGCEIVRLAVPDAAAAAALGEIRREVAPPARRRHPFRPPAGPGRHRGRRRRAADQSRQHRLRGKGAGGRPGRPGAGRSHPDRGQLGLPRKGPPGKHGAGRPPRPWPRAPSAISGSSRTSISSTSRSRSRRRISPGPLEAYRLLAAKVDYPFHAGITEAGGLLAGSVKSAAGLALLLARRPGRHDPRLPDRAPGEGSRGRLADPPGASG